MMPVGPAALANRLLGVVTAHDCLRRNKPLALPLRKAFAKQFQHLGFPRQIGGIGGCVAAFTLGIDPANAVEPFLKDIAWPGHHIVIAPPPQALWPAQGFHRPRATDIKGIDHPAVTHRRALFLLVKFQFGFRNRQHRGLQAVGTCHFLPSGDNAVFLRDHPTRSQWYEMVAALGFHLHAVEKRLGALATLVVFDAPRGDLFIRRRKDGFLRFAHFVLHGFATAEQIQTGPSQ